MATHTDHTACLLPRPAFSAKACAHCTVRTCGLWSRGAQEVRRAGDNSAIRPQATVPIVRSCAQDGGTPLQLRRAPQRVCPPLSQPERRIRASDRGSLRRGAPIAALRPRPLRVLFVTPSARRLVQGLVLRCPSGPLLAHSTLPPVSAPLELDNNPEAVPNHRPRHH